MHKNFVCPICRGFLDFQRESYICTGCEIDFPVVANVPIFLEGNDLEASICNAEQVREENYDAKDFDGLSFSGAVKDIGWSGRISLCRKVIKDLAIYFRSFFRARQHREFRVQENVKIKYERPEVNYYRGQSVVSPLWINGTLKIAPVGEYRSKLAKEIADNVAEAPDGPVLEAGCGDGLNFYYLSRDPRIKSRVFVGFDYSYRRSFLSRSHLNEFPNFDIFNGDIKKIPFADDSFSFAYTCHCLEHIPYDATEAIRELGRVARRVVLFEPVFERTTLLGKLHIKASGYVRGLECRIKDAGLKIESVRRLGLGAPFNETFAITCVRGD